MYKLTLDREEDDIQIEVELKDEWMSVFNLFKALENILLEHGFTQEEINKYYTLMNDENFLLKKIN